MLPSPWYIVTEHVDGKVLGDELRSCGPMEPSRAVEITSEVCAALNYGHRHGVAHGEVSSRNVLLARDGTVKVLNFGLALAIGHAADIRWDIHDVGCLLIDLLTGSPQERACHPLGLLTSGVPRGIYRVIRKALDIDPAKRYQSAEDMRTQLSHAYATASASRASETG